MDRNIVIFNRVLTHAARRAARPLTQTGEKTHTRNQQ